MGFYSQFLMEHLDGFSDFADEEEQKESQPTEEDRRALESVRKLCQLMIEGKAQWLDLRHLALRRTLEDFENIFERFEVEIDRLLARRSLEEVDAVAFRLKELPSVFLMRHPSTEVRKCLLEATRCYLYGLFQACAVLSRATMETAIVDRLRARGKSAWPLDLRGRVERRPDWILNLLNRARREGLVGGEDFERLDRVRTIGGKAAHGGLVNQIDARMVLINLRNVLEKMYR